MIFLKMIHSNILLFLGLPLLSRADLSLHLAELERDQRGDGGASGGGDAGGTFAGAFATRAAAGGGGGKLVTSRGG